MVIDKTEKGINVNVNVNLNRAVELSKLEMPGLKTKFFFVLVAEEKKKGVLSCTVSLYGKPRISVKTFKKCLKVN